MISKYHPNRRAHNWLIYDIFDSFLYKHVSSYKGVLYDLGAGESPYKDFFIHYVESYIAVDWAKSYHNTNTDIVADLNKPLPVESAVADTVVSFSVLEHLCEPQIMLNEAFRILKPRGEILLQVPFMWWVHEPPYDFFRYTSYGIKYLFGRAGFVDVVVEPQTGFFSMLVLKLNYFSSRFIRGPRSLQWLIKSVLLPCWFLGQKTAPLLDTIDENWEAETSGFFVIARKP